MARRGRTSRIARCKLSFCARESAVATLQWCNNLKSAYEYGGVAGTTRSGAFTLSVKLHSKECLSHWRHIGRVSSHCVVQGIRHFSSLGKTHLDTSLFARQTSRFHFAMRCLLVLHGAVSQSIRSIWQVEER